MKVYKVTERNQRYYLSCLNLNPAKAKLCHKGLIPSRIYRIGKKTRATKHSLGIFCFKTLQRAREFRGDNPSRAILMVEGIGQARLSPHIDPFYEMPQQSPSILECSPRGTICFPEVKVIQEVQG